MSNTSKQVSNAHQAAAVLTAEETINLLVKTVLFHNEHGLITRPIEILGAPGISKTAVAKAAADIIRTVIPSFQCLIIAPSTTSADELGGIPMFNKRTETGETILDYALPNWFFSKAMQPNWKGFVVLDDARQCQGDQQKNRANLIYERALRGVPIPDGVFFVLTGNRMEDRAGVAKELTHYSGRKATVHMDASLDGWTQWAVMNDISEEVIGYVNWMKDEFNQFSPEREKNPNPRTWLAVSNWMKFLKQSGIAKTPQYGKYSMALFSGEVGPGPATKFVAFCELFGHMPDLDGIIRNPSTAPIPDKIDLRYATTVALVGHTDSKTFGAALEYIQRISVEHAALYVRLAVAKDNSIRNNSKAFKDWLLANGSILLGN